MVFGSSVVWRYPTERKQFSLCKGVSLQEGYVMLYDTAAKSIKVFSSPGYKPTCYDGAPVLSTFKYMGVSHIPLAEDQWHRYLATETGSFKYSIYPIIYSITVATVMCIFLTIIVFTNHTQNPSVLLRGESTLASVNLGVLFVRAITFLSKQHERGYSSGEKLLDQLQADDVFSALDFIVVLMAQFAQVQVIIRLFSRVKEKRVSFLLGGLLSICAQAIWGVSTFANIDQSVDSDISILPAFTYLLRIALSMMYCGLIIIYGFSKRAFVFQGDIILLTILTFLVINLQFAFFVTDIASVWVYELSEIFNTTIYVSVTVIPWEWINRVHNLERYQQTEGIIGRPVYEEDEYKDIARYEIIDDTENNINTAPQDFGNDNPDDNNNTGDEAQSRINTPLVGDSKAASHFGSKIKNSLANTTNTLLHFTDQVIAFGLAVPRSVSVNSSTMRRQTRKKRPIIPPSRKEVFVYSKKEVICDSDNEQTATTRSEDDDDDDLYDDDVDHGVGTSSSLTQHSND